MRFQCPVPEAASEVDRRRTHFCDGVRFMLRLISDITSACCLVQYAAVRPVVFRASAGRHVPRWLRSFLILVYKSGEIMMWAHLCLFSIIISLLDEHKGYFSHHAFTFKSYWSLITVASSAEKGCVSFQHQTF